MTTARSALIAPLHDAPSAACVGAERAMLAALDGSCRTPIAGLATIAAAALRSTALLLSPDGAREYRASGDAAPEDAPTLGAEIGARLRRGRRAGFRLVGGYSAASLTGVSS